MLAFLARPDSQAALAAFRFRWDQFARVDHSRCRDVVGLRASEVHPGLIGVVLVKPFTGCLSGAEGAKAKGRRRWEREEATATAESLLTPPLPSR